MGRRFTAATLHKDSSCCDLQIILKELYSEPTKLENQETEPVQEKYWKMKKSRTPPSTGFSGILL